MKLTLGGLMQRVAARPPRIAPMRKVPPMPRVTRGTSTLHLKKLPLSKVRAGDGY
jgi:hypothetical protein